MAQISDCLGLKGGKSMQNTEDLMGETTTEKERDMQIREELNRQMEDESVDDQHLFDLQQKINDLKAELEMSPRQFEDKLL